MKRWIVLFIISVIWMIGSEKVSALEVDQSDVSVNHEWEVTFNEPVKRVFGLVRDRLGYYQSVTVSQVGDYRVRIKPVLPYTPNEIYTIDILPATSSTKGHLLEPYQFVFKTRDLPKPEPEPEPEPMPMPKGDLYLSDYSFKWVHDPDTPFTEFHLDGRSQDGKLMGGITMSARHDYGLPGKVGYTRDYVRQLHKDDKFIDQIFNGKYVMRLTDRDYIDTFLTKDKYIHYIYDVHNNNRVRTIFWVTIEAENEREFYFTKGDERYEESMADLVWLFTNAARAKGGVHLLERDERLDKVAKAHSIDMIERDYFNHVNLDGKDQDDRVREAGIFYYGMASENITKGQQNAVFAHEAFMNSIGHQLTIMEVGYNTLGVGVKLTRGGNPHVTQVFVRMK